MSAGIPSSPLSDAARANMQARVDEAYDLFVRAVARGRSASDEKVRNGFGRGAVLPANAALTEGLVDRVEAIETTMRLMGAASARERRPGGAVAKRRRAARR